MRAKAKIERDRLERGRADELAGAMNEFFTALYTEHADATPTPDMSTYMSSFADPPLASPDSITVTTEFGVLEETGNVTIISAGGAAHPYDEADENDDDFDDELDYAHMHEDGPESYVVMTEDTSAPSPDWVTAVALQHHQQQNTWLLQQQMQQQMQSMYSVAMGSNSTPPPVQLVAPTVYHQQADVDALLSESSGDDALDDGVEADVDTDEVLESADDEGVPDGAVTPTGVDALVE